MSALHHVLLVQQLLMLALKNRARANVKLLMDDYLCSAASWLSAVAYVKSSYILAV